MTEWTGPVSGAAASFLPRLEAGAQEPAEQPDQVVYLAPPRPSPVWSTMQLFDARPTMLLRVPEDHRFVLTDLWLMSREGDRVPLSPNDRVWLERVVGAKRFIVFDSLVGELPNPIQWRTGVSFLPGDEVWLNYAFSTDQPKRPRRRVHFTGYLEPLPSAEETPYVGGMLQR